MEVNWVLIAAAVLVVGLVLMNMQKSRFDSYGATGDEYAPVDTYAEEMYGDDAENGDDEESDEEYAGDEAEDEEEYAGDEAEDEYAGDESDGEDEETDEVEEFTLMEPTIDDKYANALFTPPLL